MISTPCTIVRRTIGDTTDELGDPIADEELVETVCDLQQRQRSEPVAEGELAVSVWDCFFPSGTEVDTSDAVIVGAHEYEVVGEPWDANQGSATVNHVATTLKKTGDAAIS